jgi:hypothetical protein
MRFSVSDNNRHNKHITLITFYRGVLQNIWGLPKIFEVRAEILDVETKMFMCHLICSNDYLLRGNHYLMIFSSDIMTFTLLTSSCPWPYDVIFLIELAVPYSWVTMMTAAVHYFTPFVKHRSFKNLRPHCLTCQLYWESLWFETVCVVVLQTDGGPDHSIILQVQKMRWSCYSGS